MSPEWLILVLVVLALLLLLTGFPVAFTLAGTSLIVAVTAALSGLFDIAFVTSFPQRIFALMRNQVLAARPLFIFMGVMLERSRVAEDMLLAMGRLFGSVRGGLCYAVTIVGALLAASTGIVGATVATMGLLSLPTMLKRGYDPALACGSICAAGTLGQLIPPSIVLVLLGDQLAAAYQKTQYDQGNFAPDVVSVNDLFAGALLPGLLLVALYLVYQALVAWRRPQAAPAMVATQLSKSLPQPHSIRHLLQALAAPLILVVAVLGSILAGLATPTEAAGVGAVGALLLAGHRANRQRGRAIELAVLAFLGMLVLTWMFDLRLQREQIPFSGQIAIVLALICSVALLNGVAVALVRVYRQRDAKQRRTLGEVLRQTLLTTSMIFAILIGASMFSLVFRGLGGDTLVREFLLTLPGGAGAMLLVVMVTLFLLGFVLDFVEIIYIVVPIVAPLLLAAEWAPGVPISPVWLGVMIAVNLQTSFLTPPFGFALFYLRGVAPSAVRTTQIYRGVAPFVVIQLLMLVVLWQLPAIATWLPALIYGP